MTSTKSYIQMKEKYDRVVVLVDMDCFYCQVEELLDDNLRGKNLPIAVVQYVENAGIIAVNYVARAMGVTRHMREKEAKAKCSELICIKVPSKYNKADISKYKDAGKRVADVFEKFTQNLERASVDEAYLDITDNVAARMLEMKQKKFALQPHHLFNTYAVGYNNIGSFIKDVSASVDASSSASMDHETQSLQSSKLRLLLGASIVSDIRKAVKEETGYECSAGIAHNKILAKLVCGMNKPNKQTLLPIDSIPTLFKTLEISKVKGLGGKIGEDVCSKLDVKFMADLMKFQESELLQNFGQRIGSFLYLSARGIDLEKVERKVMNKCIAVSKNFRGKNEIVNVNSLKFWIKELSKELKERIDRDQAETNRVAKQMTVQFTQRVDNKDVASSRVVQLNGNTVNSLDLDEIVQEVFNTIERHTSKLLRMEGKCVLNNNIKHLGIGVAKLEEPASAAASTNQIQAMLKNYAKKSPKAEMYRSKNPTESSKVSEATEEKGPEVAQTPQCSREDPSPAPSSRQFELCVQNRFQRDSMIKGEKTLKHWLSQILRRLINSIQNKSTKDRIAPGKIQLLWQQTIGNDERSFSETIPLDIFTDNLIKVDFLLNIMNDSVAEFITNDSISPISMIQMKAVEFETRDSDWNVMMENSLSSEENEDHANASRNCQESDNEMNLGEEAFDGEEEELETNLRNESKNHDENSDNDHDELAEMEEEYLQLSSGIEGCQPASGSIEQVNYEEPQKSIEVKETRQNITVKSPEELGVGPSYMQTYAEFQRNPVVDILNPLEECLECGKMIRKLDMLTHLDGHIAMQISISQREEFRAEQKRKLLCQSNQKSAKKTSKPKASPTAPVSITSIEKFAKKLPQCENISDDQELCLQCNKLVLKDEMLTHTDHHFAQELRMEQMKVKTQVTPGTITSTTSNKRKRPVSASDKSKNLKAFFKQ